MRITTPKLGGGGGALESMFPGYKDKIWARIPLSTRQAIIRRDNSKFEAAAKSQCITAKNRIAAFYQVLWDPLKPSEQYGHHVVDYKRQYARGTFVAGRPCYLPEGGRDRLDMRNAENIFEPFTAEEQAERKNNRTISFGTCSLAIAGLSFLYYHRHRNEPVVWCMEQEPPHAPEYPFYYKKALHSHDVASLRRGYEVYRKVCSTCHSMQQLHFRHLVNEVLPEKRVKQIAASYDVLDGPNPEGEMFSRPGILNDAFPSPYPNEEAARYANGGAAPPDLSVYAGAKHGGADYFFALLTSYRDPPVGMELRPGLYYNTYFPGGAIAMPPPLTDECIEYEDGTPATVSQMAKDICNFLVWACEPTHDHRKLTGLKATTGTFFGALLMGYWYRFLMINYRTRRVDFTRPVM